MSASRAPRLFLPFLASCFVLAVPVSVHAASTVHVDASKPGGPGCGAAFLPCSTLTEAIATATTGDTIQLVAGTYAGATISKPLTILGPDAGVAGSTRAGATTGRSANITSTIVVPAAAGSATVIDGLNFATATGHGIELTGGSPMIRNNVFALRGSGRAISANSASTNVRITANAFEHRVGGINTAIWLHGDGAVAGVIRNARIDGNSFRGYNEELGGDSATAINVGGVPGLRIDGNVATRSSTFVVLVDTNLPGDAFPARVVIADNKLAGFDGSGIFIGKGVHGADITGNTMRDGMGNAISLSSAFGTDLSTKVSIVANDFDGFVRDVSVAPGAYTGILDVHANRIGGGTQTAVRNQSADTTIDARRNWWLCNEGTEASGCSTVLVQGTSGAIDTSDHLQLIVSASQSRFLPNAVGNVTVQLAGSTTGTTAVNFPSVSVTLATTSGTLGSSTLNLVGGAAATSFTAPATLGISTVSASLDNQVATRDITISAAAPPPAPKPVTSAPSKPIASGDSSASLPGSADTVIGSSISSRLIVGVSTKLRTFLAKGVTAKVSCSRSCTIHTTVTISNKVARRLGLRTARSTTKAPFIIAVGTARRGAPGVTMLRLKLTKAAARRLTKTRSLDIAVTSTVVSSSSSATSVQHAHLR